MEKSVLLDSVKNLHADGKEAVKQDNCGAYEFFLSQFNKYLVEARGMFGDLNHLSEIAPVPSEHKAAYSGGVSAAEKNKMVEVVTALGQLHAFPDHQKIT